MADVRRAIITALIKQEKDGYSNLVLNAAQERFNATQQERAFFTAVFYGTIERTVTIDYILQKFLTKPINKTDPEVRCIMRSALYQAKYMDSVPAFAAINEAVKLTRKMGKSSAAGMVNAVLRKAVDYKIENELFKSDIEKASVLYSVSKEVAQVFVKNYPDKYEEILEKSFDKTKLCLRVNTLLKSTQEILDYFTAKVIETVKGYVEHSLYVIIKAI